MNHNIDYDAISTSALQHIDALLDRFLPGGEKKGREYTVLNPNRSDRKPGSFKINLNSGKWCDFATGDKGGDLISLIAYTQYCSQSDAAQIVAEFIGVPIPEGNSGNKGNKVEDCQSSEQSKAIGTATPALLTANPKVTPVPIIPIPKDAPPPPERHPKLGNPTGKWTYTTSDGRPAFHILRFDSATGEKEFRPLTYCKFAIGSAGWKWTSSPSPRPLYRLHNLVSRPEASVIICEGEKAGEAAQKLFPDLVTTTWSHGAKAVNQTDWSALKGRKCWLWPDWDDAGRAAMNLVSQQLEKIGAASIETINVLKFAGSPQQTADTLPNKFDAADALAAGWTSADVQTFLKEPDFLTQNTHFITQAPKTTKYPSQFQLNENGVFFQNSDEDSTPLFICSPLAITAAVSDGKNQSWGRRLEFNDMRGNHHSWCMPMEMLKAGGEEYRGHLLNMGLNIASGNKARNLLSYLIQMTNPNKFARCVNMTGWHDNVFVLPERTIGNSAREEIFFQSDSPFQHGFSKSGSLDEWKQTVGAWSVGNSRLIFALCTGFSAPLLHLIGEEGGGFNLRGASSIGKSTALLIAGSLYGGKEFVKTWRATDNGLEGTAKSLNHLLLLLDEMGQVDAHKAGEIAYMLSNGATKQRANRSGAARAQEHWQLIFLSSGEIGLADHMRSVGKRATGGQEIRVIDFPADAGADLGLFENLHGHHNGDAFARALKLAASQYHGEAGLQFIECLTNNLDSLPEMIKDFCKDFLEENVPTPADGQVTRAAGRFALLAAAGEIATQLGITGWQPGEATQAISKCFLSWLELRGGVGAQESAAIIAQVRLFFEQHGESRFTPLDRTNTDRATINRAGFRKEVGTDASKVVEYYVLPEVFKAEICKGFDPTTVGKLLVREGYIAPDIEGKPVSVHRLPGMKSKRCYKFTSKVSGE